MVEVYSMHAGEEALLILVPVVIVFAWDYWRRHKLRNSPPATSEVAGEGGKGSLHDPGPD